MLNTLIPGQLPARQQQLLADPAAGVPEEVADQVSDCVGVRREGSEFPVDLTIFTWEMGGQRIGGAVARDTSERKRFEAERASLREQFLQAQKLEVLATLAGGVAHNFNNLLGVIIGRADLARMAVPNGSPVGEDLDEIMVAGRRGADLVRQLLDFGRPSTARWERISLGKLLRETAGLLEINLAAGINFTLEGDTQALDVQGDPSQLQQVIMNFCVNAQHAIRRGAGNVQVRLDAVEIAPERVVAIGNWPRAGTPPVPTRLDALAEGRGGRLWLGLLAAGGHARISVTDDGSGMDREVLARVFDPFFTTKPIGQGTGLGLSAVRGIALVHGGALAIETEQGKGSRFEMYLPICK
jgi:signal transduction histidine kinase